MSRKETPEQERERLYREEQTRNHRTQAGTPNTSGMSIKEIGVLIIIILVIFIVYSIYKSL